MVTRVNFYDVMIVGGGPSGTMCATLLARLGLRVVLFYRYSRAQHPFEVFAPELLRSLRRLRFPLPDGGSCTRCRGILRAWTGLEDFFDYELFKCEPALCVNRYLYDRSLQEYASANGVEARLFSKQMQIQADGEAWHVLAEGHPLLSAAFLVDASGRSGSFLPPQIAGGRTFQDRTVGCSVRNIRCVQDQDMLMLEATSSGWWYLCQSTVGEFALVYLTDADILGRGKEERTRHLYQSFSDTSLIPKRLRGTPMFEMHSTFDARRSRRRSFVGSSWLAVGDAAFTSDPLSGQGVLIAVASAEVAASAIWAFQKHNDSHYLTPYVEWCEIEYAQQQTISSQVYSTVRSTFHNQGFWSRRL